jgi:hypothetical protein
LSWTAEEWRLFREDVLEMRAILEAHGRIKGYSPLRRWLRQERARANQEQLDSMPTPDSRPFKARFVFHGTFEPAQFLVRHR